MTVEPTKLKVTGPKILSGLFLFGIIATLIIFNAHIVYGFLFLLLYFSTFLLSFLFWNFFLFPHSDWENRFHPLWHSLRQLFLKPAVFLKAENGQLDKPYFLLQNKPRIVCLNIDSTSALVVQDKKAQLTPLTNGTFKIKKTERIIHIFDLNLNCFHYGPSLRNHPTDLNLVLNYPPQNLTEEIKRQETQLKTRDGKYISLIYLIFYRFDTSELEQFLPISETLISNEKVGETKTIIQKSIGQIIHQAWAQHIIEMDMLQFSKAASNPISFDNLWIINAISNEKIQRNEENSIHTALIRAIKDQFLNINFQIEKIIVSRILSKGIV